MDRVRLGRALGKGARAAARTAMEAVEAASAPSPTPRAQAASQQRQTSPQREQVEPQQRTVPRTTGAPRSTMLPPLPISSYARPARAAAAGVAGPLRKASRALWHEVTGSFFALFGLSFALGVWHTRATAVSPVANERYRFYAFCAFAVLFAYFSVSSFLRARQKD